MQLETFVHRNLKQFVFQMHRKPASEPSLGAPARSSVNWGLAVCRNIGLAIVLAARMVGAPGVIAAQTESARTSRSARELAQRYRSAHAQKDVAAIQRLFFWGGATEQTRTAVRSLHRARRCSPNSRSVRQAAWREPSDGIHPRRSVIPDDARTGGAHRYRVRAALRREREVQVRAHIILCRRARELVLPRYGGTRSAPRAAVTST
jgi:hypothetical protein